jgi:hypothetical protein
MVLSGEAGHVIRAFEVGAAIAEVWIREEL